jgi:hypothetical protein
MLIRELVVLVTVNLKHANKHLVLSLQTAYGQWGGPQKESNEVYFMCKLGFDSQKNYEKN